MSTSKQFVLPFAAPLESRKEPFSNEAELAAIFALSELERKNGGLNSTQERCVYILKIGYPLWFIVSANFTYIFDGLNKISHSWTGYETLQAKFELEVLEVNFRIREKYIEFLVNYQKNVHQTHSSKEFACEGLIANNALAGELNSYRREATEVYDQTLGLLLPVLKEKKATETISQIEALQLVFREKTEEYRQLAKLISKTTERYIEGFSFESKAIVEEAEAKIKAQKEIINPKIEKITRNYKKQVERLEKNADKEKLPFEKQKKRIEKTIKETEKIIERYSRQAKVQAQKGNKRSEDSLKKKLKKEKQNLDELQNQYKKVEKQLKILASQKTDETVRLKSTFDREIAVERQPITTLEVLLYDKQEFFKQERRKLEELTHVVIEEIDQLVDEREKLSANMELLGLKSDSKLKNNAILYVPFYIAAYSREEAKVERYFVFPPSLVCSLGLSAKLKGVLGRAKIKDLFNERFRAVSSLGEKLQSEAFSNRSFIEQLEGLVQKNNLLDMKPLLREGLFLLKEEGWFSESDYQMILTGV